MIRRLLLIAVLTVSLVGAYGCFDENSVEPEATNINEGLGVITAAACIGDLVWFDENANGCQDEGEPGVGDIRVELYRCGDGLVGNTTTDGTGYYCFQDLQAGEYYVQFYERDHYFFTHQTPCQDDHHDSDADENTGRTVCFSIGADDCLKSVDAGLCVKPTEGCTPGYWKNHLTAWQGTGYSPFDNFNATFGCTVLPSSMTLGEAVRKGGGHQYRLGRHGVAALLSAAHSNVDYGLTVAQVIALVCSGDADTLEENNEMGCPLGKYGQRNDDDD